MTVRCADCGRQIDEAAAKRMTVFGRSADNAHVVESSDGLALWLDPQVRWYCLRHELNVEGQRSMMLAEAESDAARKKRHARSLKLTGKR